MNNNSYIEFLKSLVIAIPFLLGLARFNRIENSYRPLIIFLFFGLLFELLSFIVSVYSPQKSNAVPSNLYVLLEGPFIIWMFYSWNILKGSKKVFFALAAVLIVIWITENIVFHNINSFSPYYRILYYCLVVLLSINIINYTIINNNGNLFQNARFVICLSFIFFFTYKLMYEWAYQYCNSNSLNASKNIIISSFGYVNVLENIILTIAVALIPEKVQKVFTA